MFSAVNKLWMQAAESVRHSLSTGGLRFDLGWSGFGMKALGAVSAGARAIGRIATWVYMANFGGILARSLSGNAGGWLLHRAFWSASQLADGLSKPGVSEELR
ncbi:MAG: hypothetical protein NZ899_13870 [Thermoguttaceae bacterium]|nr:hypothetical protein [Thermoguttaceae bacterium]MDW8080155.1 hypothetical protein [Thermoguttaceae bacterium]